MKKIIICIFWILIICKKNIEDTFRYYDAMEDEVSVCEVVGLRESSFFM